MINTYYKKIEFLVSLISKFEPIIGLVDSNSKIELQHNNIIEIINDVKEYNLHNSDALEYELRGNNAITIDKDKYRIFFEREDFKNNIKLDYLKKDFCILETNDFFVYNSASRSVIHNSQEMSTNNFFSNFIYYLYFIDYLKDDTSPNKLCTFNDKLNEKLILIIPKKGKFEIKYKTYRKDYDEKNNYFELYNKLLKVNSDYIPFLKNEIYDNIKDCDFDKKLQILIRNINTIIDNADNNYELYISKFSVKSFIKGYRKQQNKYLSIYNDLLNKIYVQSVGVPVSLTLTIVGLLNVKEQDNFATYLIICVYFLFSVASIFHLWYLYQDIKVLECEFISDKNKIDKSFLIRDESLNKVFESLSKKSKSLKLLIILIGTIISVLAILIVLFGLL